ncbi:MAG: hypothetical protein K2I69_06740 [Muribaculaceae bacterium]|nr:hypothetical protein [Muribaculaceae bacterium]
MHHITDLFQSLIDQFASMDMAEAEFRRMLVDDPELRREYKEYCREMETSDRRGFAEYCEEYMVGQNEVWDSLNDYDNEE